MRKDVIDLVRELKIPIVRYPGGNFVSAYNWEDGVGPREKRPTRLDLAWHTSESNAVGVHEFAHGADGGDRNDAGDQPRLARARRGAQLCRIRQRPDRQLLGRPAQGNGRAEPFGVKHWCLGNEMDGPWQVGHKTAHEYGRLANEVAKTLRAFDPSLELIVCGSSNSDMKTYPEWERVVLEHTYEAVDHISLHMYFANRSQEHRRISRPQRQARRLHRRRRLDDRVRARRQAQPKAGDDLPSTNGTSGIIRTRRTARSSAAQGLAARAAAARGRLQLRGRAPGRLHPQHLHPPLATW